MTNTIEGTTIEGLAAKLSSVKERFENNPLVQIDVFGISGSKMPRKEARIALDSGAARGLETLGEVLVRIQQGNLEDMEITADGTARFMFTQKDGMTIYYEENSGDCVGGDCPEEARERLVIETVIDGDPNKTIDVEASLPVVRG